VELGIYTFADLARDPATGRPADPAGRLRDLLEEAELADQVGLDVFGLGEHHRPEYAVSAPAVVLGAIAARTTGIRLTSAVSVLSSDDPVRVFQQFATLDLLSNGRAEIMAGRGSFIESFPLFGYDLDDYDDLFTEKLDLLLAARGSERVTWSGRLRAPIRDRGVYPQPVQHPLPVWIAVGGTPQSVLRAGSLGLPLAVAIIGGEPARFAPLLDLYRRALGQAGHPGAGDDPAEAPIGVNLHGLVAGTSGAAAEAAFGPYQRAMSAIGRERGFAPSDRTGFDAGCGPDGHLMVGSPDQVADKILRQHEALGHRRTMLQMDVGGVGHLDLMRSIELFGTRVAPTVRSALA
jgi:probable LLM family oxidoreductase